MDRDLIRSLRGRKPSGRSSTYDPVSANAVNGGLAELVVKETIELALAARDLSFTVHSFEEYELMLAGAHDDDWEPDDTMRAGLWAANVAARNHRCGDLVLLDEGDRPMWWAEVKSSVSYQSVSIDAGELFGTSVDYLMAYNPNSPVKFWMTRMEDAREGAREITTAMGNSFWVVDPDRVKLIKSWDEIFRRR